MGVSVSSAQAKQFSRRLLDWAEGNLRDFPWRRTKNPYRVLVAELMLQRTQARQVLPVYAKFLDVYPTVMELKGARVEDVWKLLYPLGLAYRAERFVKIADMIAEEFGGVIPRDEAALRGLPGVGWYIANAVLCFTWGKRVPIVDTNVARILHRVFSLVLPSQPHKNRRLWGFMEQLLPGKDVKTFNLALLDLGHKICTPLNPACGNCPLAKICEYARVSEFLTLR